MLRILSPTDSSHDASGDHFVDLVVEWSDPGGIDTASVVVRSLYPVVGPGSGAANLRQVWRTIRLDSTGIVLRETLENLLPDGLNRLVVSVRDTAGNEAAASIDFGLPSIVLYDSIITGITSSSGVPNTRGIAIDQAGRRGYAGVSDHIVVFDAESLRVIDRIPSAWPGRQIQRILLDEPRGLAYVSGLRIERLNLTTLELTSPVTGSFATVAMARSRIGPALLYVAEQAAGWLGYVNLESVTRFDEVVIPNQQNEFPNDLAVLPGDAKLYMTRFADNGGLVVIDPATKQILRRIDSINGGPFFSDCLELASDNRIMYVTLTDAVERGIAVLDTQADTLVRFHSLHQFVPFAARLSPSGRRLFVTTFDVSPTVPSVNLLLDANNLALSYGELPRPRLPGTIRRDGYPAFRPDGKLVFVGRELNIDVYLHRERP